MQNDQWKRVDEVFRAALARPEDQRADFIKEECRNEVAVLIEVQDLLKHDRDATSTLSEAACGVAGEMLEEADSDSLTNRRVGAYQVGEVIGAGGMGKVYLAHRADGQYEQKVAIKFVKRGMDTDEILRRFRTERQSLASLDHPNIAKLIDAGATEDGLPYFVMEYVDGRHIDQYCDEHSMSIGERIELFRQVCAAVHHAHQNLIIHRDLKPSNILVTDEGRIKLLDFGTAKLLTGDHHDTTQQLATEAGRQVLTPGYASPEQIRGDTITTATDVYSLGVVLYELLSGRRPHWILGQSPSEVERIICEVEPPKPSLVAVAAAQPGTVSCYGDKTRSAQTSGVHRGRTHKLSRQLSGDLDTIVMMALRKEPQRRYKSAEQLSDDLQHYLKGLPVIAQKDTLRYRSRKFIRRHKVGVLTALMFAILLVGGSAGLGWLTVRSQKAEARARENNALLLTYIDAINPWLLDGRAETLEAIIDHKSSELLGELADSPGLEAQIRNRFGEVYYALACFTKAERQFRLALEAGRREYQSPHPVLASSLQQLALVMRYANKLEEAEAVGREALQEKIALLGTENLHVAQAQTELALTLLHGAHYDEAEELLRHALATRITFLGEQDRSVASTRSFLFLAGDDAGRKLNKIAPELSLAFSPDLDALLELNDKASVRLTPAEIRQQLSGMEAQSNGLLSELSPVASQQKLWGENPHPLDAEISFAQAMLAESKGEYCAAAQHYHDALRVWSSFLSDDHTDVVAAERGLAEVEAQCGDEQDNQTDLEEPRDQRPLRRRPPPTYRPRKQRPVSSTPQRPTGADGVQHNETEVER